MHASQHLEEQRVSRQMKHYLLLALLVSSVACTQPDEPEPINTDDSSDVGLMKVLEGVRSRSPGTPCFPEDGASCDGCGPQAVTHLGEGYLGITGQTIEGRCHMKVLINEHGKASVLNASCDHNTMTSRMTNLVTTTKWDTVSKQGLSCKYIDQPFDYMTSYGHRF